MKGITMSLDIPSVGDPHIDSLDVIKVTTWYEELLATGDDEINDLSDEIIEVLDALRALNDECAEYVPDWKYGAILISDWVFDVHAREVAEEVLGLDTRTWPYNKIDWKAAADELRSDYYAVRFGNHTYWVR